MGKSKKIWGQAGKKVKKVPQLDCPQNPKTTNREKFRKIYFPVDFLSFLYYIKWFREIYFPRKK
jgi:hypothetical protein